MVPTIFAMIIIVALAAIVLGMVVVGMEGQGRWRAPEMASTLAKAGRHLNGEAEPPKGLVQLFEEAEDGADDLRQLPANLRSRSGASTRSGASASSATPHEESKAATWAAPEIAKTFPAGSVTEGASAWGDEHAVTWQAAQASSEQPWQPAVASAAPAASVPQPTADDGDAVWQPGKAPTSG